MEELHENSHLTYLQFEARLLGRLGYEEDALGLDFDAIEGAALHIGLNPVAANYINMGEKVRCSVTIDEMLGCKLTIKPRNIFNSQARHFLILPHDQIEGEQTPFVREIIEQQPNPSESPFALLETSKIHSVPAEVAESLIDSLITLN